MTRYARVVDGSPVDFELPENDVLKDGRMVSGYRNLPAEVLLTEGWYPVVDNGPPTFDSNTQRAVVTGYQVNESAQQVEITYVVEELPPPPEPEPDYDAMFKDAVSKATTLAELKAVLIGSVGPGAQPKRGRP